MNWVMLAKRLNLGFLKRSLMRLRSATMPSRLLGFFTSIKISGMPLISSVMSGRNSSSPFSHVSSVTTWKLFDTGTVTEFFEEGAAQIIVVEKQREVF